MKEGGCGILIPSYPLSPGPSPVVHSGFYISGPIVVFLIIVTVLSNVSLCGILIYILIRFYSKR
jgi:hypothetical protein